MTDLLLGRVLSFTADPFEAGEGAARLDEAVVVEAGRIVAVVGPCVSQTSYEVDLGFMERFEHHEPDSDRFFALGHLPDKRQFDLPGFVLWQLEKAGVGTAAWTGHDTRTDETLFYSNRRAFLAGEPDFGRQMSVISL